MVRGTRSAAAHGNSCQRGVSGALRAPSKAVLACSCLHLSGWINKEELLYFLLMSSSVAS